MARKRKAFSKLPSSHEEYHPDKKAKRLFEAILKLKTTEEAAKFFRDLLTIGEIEEFSNRWQMAKLLSKGYSYSEVAEKVGASTTTVARVAHWLFSGCGGYKLILERFKRRKK